MRTHTVHAWTRAHLDDRRPRQYDAIIAILTVEHDGLGRYGDPINADGDVRLLRRLHCVLKPGGRLFLAVALGARDVLVWNLRRVYSATRLAALLAASQWTERARVGFDASRVAQHTDYRQTYAPVVVLVRREPVRDEL